MSWRPSRTSPSRPDAATGAFLRIGEQAELRRVAARLGEPEMPERLAGEQAAARRALDEAALNEERLDDLLDGVAPLRQRRRDGLDADRTAAVIHRDRGEVAPVHGVEPGGVNLKRKQRAVRHLAVDRRRLADQREIPHPPQQPAGDARRAAGATSDLVATVGRHADAEHAGAAIDDQLKLGLGVEIEPDRNAETVAQRVGEEAGPGGGPDEGELRQIDLDGPRCRSLPDDEIKLEILHGGIENFLDRRIEPVDLVDEQHVALFEVGEQRREVASFGDHRTRRGAEIDAEFARHDLRERGLAEAGRAHQQYVIERLAPRARRLDEDAEVLARLLLADELAQPLRAQRGFGDVLVAALGADQAAGRRAHLVNSLASSLRPRRISRDASAPSPASRTAAAIAATACGWS